MAAVLTTEAALTDLFSALNRLRRPRLLIRAARHGLADYNRSRDLARLFRGTPLPPPARAVAALIEAEAELEAIRCEGRAGYSVARHVDVLIALMGEARAIPRAAPAG